MQLHRMIFRLDFPPAFKLISAWAETLELLNSNKLWTNLGETSEPRRIVAEHKDAEKGKHHFLTFEVNTFSGNFEEHPIEDPNSYETVFRDVNTLIDKVGVASFNRIGTRFFFLEPKENFEIARKAFAIQINETYWKQFDGDFSDLSITSVHSRDDQKMRLNAGPISNKEYAAWFGLPAIDLTLNNAMTSTKKGEF